MSYVPGQKCYIEDPEEGWLPGTVESAGATISVKLASGGSKSAKPEGVCAGSESADTGVPDMLNLDVLNIGAILHNLRTRGAADQYYTTVGTILCAVNPFKPLDVVSTEWLQKYIKADLGTITSLPPHIFATAKTAYEMMQKTGKSQSVVISGESGAGKTESTKLVLKYLTSVSGSTTADLSEQSSLEKMILDSNPILEAFGNAKTVRNNNSSRFGKFFEVKFDRKGKIVGGSITNYLLEKSRVVHVAQDERNYHIFYLICAGTSAEEKAKYHLQEAANFKYLNCSNILEIKGVDDKAEYKILMDAFSVLKFTADEIDAIHRLLAAILNLGNVTYKPNGDGVEITNPDIIGKIAELMNCPLQELKEALTIKTMSTATGSRRGSVYKIPLKPGEAEDSRDALSKAVYGAMFNWLVDKVSNSMAANEPFVASIGVLDIFGFESMPVNSFEQLCINFANEKLHQQFVNYVFKLDMEEYAKEDLPIKIPYTDNAACVDMVERKHTGILATLQEQCQLGQRGSDKGFIEKMHSSLAKDPYYEKPRLSQTAFIVKHYAGPISYESEGFLEKNKDTLHTDLVELLPLCAHSSVQTIFNKGIAKPKASGARSVPTVANQFKEQLTSLVSVLSATSPHYIRCLKPTEQKVPGVFHGSMMSRQLSYSGVLETIQVRKAGYAVRFPKDQFIDKFGMVVPGSKGKGVSTEQIMDAGKIGKNDWVMGKTKVFLKNERVLLLLEKTREDSIGIYAIIIQKYWRRHAARKELKRLREIERKRKEEEERRRKEEEERKRKEAEEAAAAAAAAAAEAEKAGAAAAASAPAAAPAAPSAPAAAAAPPSASMPKVPKSGVTDRNRAGSVAVPKRTMNPLDKPLVSKAVISSRPQDVIPDEPVQVTGWLSKEGSKGVSSDHSFLRHNWKRRYFVLNKGEIKYYTDDSKRDCKGYLTLDSVCSVSEVPEAEVKKLPANVGQHFFYLKSMERELKVAAEREQEKHMWMKGVTTAVRQIQKKEGKLPGAELTGLLAEVWLPDNSSLQVDVKAETTAKHIFLAVIEHVGVSKGLQYFALIEEKYEDEYNTSQRVLSESETVFDKISKSSCRLCFKKVVFVDRSGVATVTRDNPTIMNFEYSQAVSDALTYFQMPEDECIHLAALQLRCRLGQLDPEVHKPGFLLEEIHEYLPYHMVSSLRVEECKADWEAAILKKAFELNSLTSEQCKLNYVQACMKSPLYGSSFYTVKADSKHFILAVNSIGLHLIDYVERVVLHTFPYENIVKWGRSHSSFNVIQGDQQWTFETTHGEEINKFMGIYVRMLVDRKQREAAGHA